MNFLAQTPAPTTIIKKEQPPACHGGMMDDHKECTASVNGTTTADYQGVAVIDWEKRFAAAMGDNIDWFESHKDKLLKDHPDWAGKFLAVSSRTPSKILAVSEDRATVLEAGMQSTELMKQSALEGMPPGHLLNAMFLGTIWDD